MKYHSAVHRILLYQKTGFIYVSDQQNQCVKVIPLLGNGKQILYRRFNRVKGVRFDELNLLKSY